MSAIDGVSEIFDAEAPYHPRGCTAQAWSVAEVLRALVMRTKAPSHHGRPIRFQYGTQVAVEPPTFILWCTDPEGVPESYLEQVERDLWLAGEPAGR